MYAENAMYAENDGRFPDESAVIVRHPYPDQADQPRDEWPWLPGHVLGQCGPDEWSVVVDGDENLGWPDPDDPDDELLYPVCFRNSSELRTT